MTRWSCTTDCLGSTSFVRSGVVPVWRGPVRSPQQTTDLGWEAVVFADKMLSATPDRMSQVNAERLVHEARLHFDPDRAVADEEEAAQETARGLASHRDPASPATTDVAMTLDTDDAELLDQTVGRIAADLKGPWRHRRPSTYDGPRRPGSSPTPSSRST